MPLISLVQQPNSAPAVLGCCIGPEPDAVGTTSSASATASGTSTTSSTTSNRTTSTTSTPAPPARWDSLGDEIPSAAWLVSAAADVADAVAAAVADARRGGLAAEEDELTDHERILGELDFQPYEWEENFHGVENHVSAIVV